MCTQFTALTRKQLQLFAQEWGVDIADLFPDSSVFALEDQDDSNSAQIFPGNNATVLLAKEGIIQAVTLTWGFAAEWKKGLIFNTRIESAMGPGSYWKDALASRRCVVPAAAFFESHHSETTISPKTGKRIKRRYRFASIDGAPLLLAGIYNDDGRFSILTTQPNQSVKCIHDRMPIALNADEATAFLNGSISGIEDRSNIQLEATPDEGAQPSKTTSPKDGQQLSLF